ncbi:hypothetical protein CMEL01_02076, partial [Colletotrichum melonis]
TPHISKGRASLASHLLHIPPSSRLSGRTAPSARQQTSRPTSWQFTALQLKRKRPLGRVSRLTPHSISSFATPRFPTPMPQGV